MVRIVGTLGKSKEGCGNKFALLIILIFYFKNSQKSKLSLENKNLKWGEISLWNKCFSLIHINGTLLFNTFWNLHLPKYYSFLVKAFSFLDFFLETLPNNMWWCRCFLIIFFKVFWPRNSTFFWNSPAVVLEESLVTQILLLTMH